MTNEYIESLAKRIVESKEPFQIEFSDAYNLAEAYLDLVLKLESIENTLHAYSSIKEKYKNRV